MVLKGSDLLSPRMWPNGCSSRRIPDGPASKTVFVTDEFAAMLNVPQAAGLLVESVASGGLGSQLGLQGGTIRTKIEDQDVILGGRRGAIRQRNRGFGCRRKPGGDPPVDDWNGSRNRADCHGFACRREIGAFDCCPALIGRRGVLSFTTLRRTAVRAFRYVAHHGDPASGRLCRLDLKNRRAQ